MKIHNTTPVGGKTTRKTTRSSTNGVFGQVLDAETASDHATADQSDQPCSNQPNPSQSNQNQSTNAPPMQEAWHTLRESVSLLDEAIHCIEAGDSPPQQLIHDIEQLRALLRQQVSSGSAAVELKQADTLLAVEAERIRAMQS